MLIIAQHLDIDVPGLLRPGPRDPAVPEVAEAVFRFIEVDESRAKFVAPLGE
jgi:hypothetical protein